MATVTDTERQERRKKAGELLRMADKFFKFGDFEEADRLAVKATEADPGNPYAQAYRERIKYAVEAGVKKQQQLSSTVVASPGEDPTPEVEAANNLAGSGSYPEAEEDVRTAQGSPRKRGGAPAAWKKHLKEIEEKRRRKTSQGSRNAQTISRKQQRKSGTGFLRRPGYTSRKSDRDLPATRRKNWTRRRLVLNS
jgi:hypothetical protein